MTYVTDTLFNSLFDNSDPRCIAFICGGGKTTSIATLAHELCSCGARVISTTTTKMCPPEDLSSLATTATMAFEILKTKSHCFAGEIVIPKHKMCGLPDAERKSLLDIADYVLVEADGSRGKPLKMTRDYEPVIPAEAQAIVCVIGLDCIGLSLKEGCHCPELAAKFLGFTPDHRINADDVSRLVRHCYSEKAAAENPMADFCVLLNKYDSGLRESQARDISEALSGIRCIAR